VLSLLLFVAVCVLWVRSYVCVSGVRWHSGAYYRGIYSVRGRFRFASLFTGRSFRGDWNFYSSPDASSATHFELPPAPTWEILGVSYATGPWVVMPGFRMTVVTVPHWFVAAAIAAPGAAFARRAAARRRRAAHGLCQSCGYDLRATPGRCPECGTASPLALAGPQ
jgi:hypothetical protein